MPGLPALSCSFQDPASSDFRVFFCSPGTLEGLGYPEISRLSSPRLEGAGQLVYGGLLPIPNLLVLKLAGSSG